MTELFIYALQHDYLLPCHHYGSLVAILQPVKSRRMENPLILTFCGLARYDSPDCWSPFEGHAAGRNFFGGRLPFCHRSANSGSDTLPRHRMLAASGALLGPGNAAPSDSLLPSSNSFLVVSRRRDTARWLDWRPVHAQVLYACAARKSKQQDQPRNKEQRASLS